jgi:FkbM family methyltransferase
MIGTLKFLVADIFRPAAGERTEQVMLEPVLRKTDAVLEVGGCTGGGTAWLAARVARVVAVEPNPFVYRWMKRRVRKMNVTTVKAALSDSEATQYLSLERDFDMGGTLRDIGPRARRRVPVKVIRADSLGETFDGIVIDAQGEEARILRGAKETLKSARFVWVEVHHYIDGGLGDEVQAIMESSGFKMTSELTEPLTPEQPNHITERLYQR